MTRRRPTLPVHPHPASSSRCSISAGRCRQFWEHVKHLPFYDELGLESVDHKRTIPLAWHMDGVKVYKTHKAYVYSCSSLIRRGPSLDTKVLVLLIRDGDLVKPHTHNSIGKLVAYIMGVLRTGNFPLVDHEGIPFKPGQPEWEKAGTPFAWGWLLLLSKQTLKHVLWYTSLKIGQVILYASIASHPKLMIFHMAIFQTEHHIWIIFSLTRSSGF